MVKLYRPPPSEQIYESYLPGKYIGFTVERYFADRFSYLSREEWCEYIRDGRITVNGEQVDPATPLKQHDFIVTRMGMREEPPSDRTLDLVYEDDTIRAFNKGAPLAMHPCGRYFKNSLTEILKEAYPGETPRPIQRLDALTTGLAVFAKSKEVATHLMKEFEANRIDKEYLALVEGIPPENNFVVDAPVGKVKGSARGVGRETLNPKEAITYFELLSLQGDRALLKAVPKTGRTNQIRVHLASIGLPVVNDPVYGEPHKDGVHQYGLHAYRLRFDGIDGEIDLTAPWPEHFQPYWDALCRESKIAQR
ncbi:MAG: RluA family pseudouridine synthase [Nitrospinota bacterium]|nr:RluA family pseudouridine synthase [Nitrospinota bacterium]